MGQFAHRSNVLPAVLLVFVALYYLGVVKVSALDSILGRGGPSATEVAKEIGASECQRSGYVLIYRLDNSEAELFNCDRYGRRLCVTMERGVAHDETKTARAVWANALGNDRPACLG